MGPICVASSVAAATLVAFDIPAGPMAAALETYAAQSRQQLLYSPELVAGRTTPALRGRYAPDQALARLIAGSGIIVRQVRPGVLVLQAPGATVSAAEPGTAIETAVTPQVEEVIVTGTLIRGATTLAAPVTVLSRDDLDRRGAATLAEALATLPQAFGGAGTPDTFLSSSDGQATNNGLATGVNLRGLGPDATLVLVNGRRLAGTGSKGDFADVSAIPMAAIERVDVLLDGASALYGSDAVGGVVNIILRRDFEGAETRIRAGVAEGGVAQEYTVAQTFGWRWDQGSLVLSAEAYRREALRAADRRYTASGDLRPLGGSDWRTYISSPGNILTYDPQAGAYVVGWAIPAGQDGTALRPSDLIVGGINLGDLRDGMDILPEQERLSGYGHLTWSLGSAVEARAEARYSRREFAFRNTAPVAAAFVTDANPYFVSPDGSSGSLLIYSFLKELGSTRTSGISESLGLSAGLDIDLPRRWRAEVYGAYAREVTRGRNDNFLNNAFVDEALGARPDNPATPFSTGRDGFLNLYGEGASNSRQILDFISSGYTRYRNESDVASLNFLADGPLWSLPGGDIKLALGGQVRQETFGQSGVNFTNNPVPTVNSRPTFERTVTAAFAELRIPLVGESNARPGVRRLELSVAGRIEDYDDVGRTANPKIGAVWSPIDGLDLRATYGSSFRAPALIEVFERNDIMPGSLPRGPVRVLAMIRYGGNADLKPETATTWTAGVDYKPAALPDLTLGATWFDIDFTDRIGRPVTENIDTALTDPTFAPFVRLVDPRRPDDRALLQSLMDDPAYNDPSGYPIDAFGAIVDGRNVNTAALRVRGLDLSAQYRWRIGADRLQVLASATYLADFERRVSPTAPPVQLADTAGQPVDLRARVAATWSRGSSETTVTLNYVDDYKSLAGDKIDSWTTIDLAWRWQPAALWGVEDLTLSVMVQNLFDTDPPFYDSPRGVGYDPANADPLGRVVAFQASRRW